MSFPIGKLKFQNLFDNLPDKVPEEVFETLIQTGPVRFERIISQGHSTLPGQWYDQETDEWVLLLQGKAQLRIDGQSELLELNPGDAILLPAHLRHRVEWTAPNQFTIWLAVHITITPVSRG